MQSEFKKTLAQKKATVVLAGPAKHVALSGGSRAGKSLLIIYAIIIRAAKVKSRHCILRLNFNHIKRSIVMDTFPKVMSMCFPNLKYTMNKTDYVAILPNGSEIFFGGLDTGERVEKILGQEFSSIFFNEISQIDYSSVQVALTRLAEKNELKKKVYYDMNPGTKATWPYQVFINKLDPIENVPLKNIEDYAYFQMNPIDNLENIDSDYLKLLEAMPEKERNRFLNGEFNDESDGQVYYSFRREQHVSPVSKQPGTIFIGMDFNVSPMTAAIIQLINNKLCILDEVYLENSDTYKMTSELNIKGLKGSTIIPDSTGANRKTSGMSDFNILEQAGFRIMPTRNPFVFDRVNNVNRLFQQDRIIIDPKCRKLINDLEKVSWKDNKLDQSGANKHLTHISDCLGYACWALDPINPSVAKVEFQGRK